MRINEYQDKTHTTAMYPADSAMSYLALGLTGEAGEIADKVKKVIRDDGSLLLPEKRKDLAKELGDLMWYTAQFASFLGYGLEEIAEMNLQKLNDRKNRNQLGGSGDDR